jgi:hypothetical protein
MDYEEQLEKWFELYGAYDYKPELKFETLETKFNECEQVSALVFLASKLKDKSQRFFLHGEHDTLYIGALDDFEDFTEEDVKIACCHGIQLADEGDGFQMYASM